MPSELVTVNLTRENENEEWGFELAGGGRDKNVRLYIEQIRPGSIAEKVGLKAKDSLVKIGNDCALDYTIDEALESLKRGKDFFDMIVEREAPDVVLQQLVVEDPRYDGLKKEDRGKVGLNDVSKPTLRKDWNCPWIRRDGKGIKRVVRYIDQVPAPIKTSQNHFYSEPGSILAPDAPPMAPEELEQLIQERMGLIEQEEAAKREAMAPKKNETSMAPQPMQEERFEQNKMEVEFSHQQQQLQMQQQHQQQQNIEMHSEENGDLDEEDSCPPDLEAVDVVQQQESQQQESVGQEPRAEAPAPAPAKQALPFQLNFDSDLLKNLTEAIMAGMDSYQGSGSYEPSADELIDVLKSLENLAAANPALYKAIVDQIKVCHSNVEEPIPAPGQQQAQQQQQQQPEEQQQHYEEVNGHGINGVDEQNQGYSEVDQHEQNFEEPEQINGAPEISETDRAVPAVPEEPKTAEQLRQEQIQKEVEREHEQQMRMLKEKKMREKEPPPPKEPKTITVMAGSRNKPSWPIAPGIANSNEPRQITLTSGEDEEDMFKNRMEVAQAAGLKHIDVIHGDETFYQGSDYPWSGSLRPVGNKVAGRRAAGRPDEDGAASPWAGSLRHIDPKQRRKKQSKAKDEDEAMYGNAPWMGTLRHVKNENKVTALLPTPKFKKYPDEDAPNPFESMQGRDAKPVYPLTPAAVIPPGGSSSEAKKNRQQMEEVERITAGLRETRTLSKALLKALMPKLLKEHENKYEPLGQEESFHIMEEILAMQVGINVEGPADGRF